MTKSESRAAALLGRKGGRSRSEAKQNAARSNGKRGGRPISVGSRVIITGGNWPDLVDQWGIVKLFDGELYHVAIANDPTTALVYKRREIRVTDAFEDHRIANCMKP